MRQQSTGQTGYGGAHAERLNLDPLDIDAEAACRQLRIPNRNE